MENKEEIYSEEKLRRKTITSFLVFIIFLLLCFFGWKWLYNQPKENGALRPLRRGLQANELLFSSLFRSDRLSKEYSPSDVVPFVRMNGRIGLKSEIDTSDYKLKIARNNRDTLKLSMPDIRKLPKTEIIFNFKCIEGWSQVTKWGGVKFSDFVKAYGLETEATLEFTGMETPDGKYYVGLDNKSMMHPQTLLCYEINGKPLPYDHGAPLRLIIPVKYGVKHIKRIGKIFFSNSRPRDYWYERGYDYYCGL